MRVYVCTYVCMHVCMYLQSLVHMCCRNSLVPTSSSRWTSVCFLLGSVTLQRQESTPRRRVSSMVSGAREGGGGGVCCSGMVWDLEELCLNSPKWLGNFNMIDCSY